MVVTCRFSRANVRWIACACPRTVAPVLRRRAPGTTSSTRIGFEPSLFDWQTIARNVDRNTLSAVAWLHDVGRPQERSGAIDDHDRWDADESGNLLEAEAVPTDDIETVEHCIRTHSIRSSSPEPEMLEAKLLFDGDKLDATGAVGIVRLACIVGERAGRAGERYAVIDDSSVLGPETSGVPDISLLREWATARLDALYTEPGRRLGASRWEFMHRFFSVRERTRSKGSADAAIGMAFENRRRPRAESAIRRSPVEPGRRRATRRRCPRTGFPWTRT